MTRRVSEETIRRIEQAAGRVATWSVAQMEDRLTWFRELPPAQRSWVTLVAQAGVSSYVQWLRSPNDVLVLTGEVFAAAPQAMARSVTLSQTVELIRTAIEVAEANLPPLAAEDEEQVREELLRFSREIAFAAARVYAAAAESRGTWDTRLEALVIDSLVRGTGVGDPLSSQLAALGWRAQGPLAAIVGQAPAPPPPGSAGDPARAPETSTSVHRIAGRLGVDAMSGVHGARLVIVIGGTTEPVAAAQHFVPIFAEGPVVVSPVAAELDAASAVTQAALSGLRVVPAWPGAPRPVSADELLPERALAGDADARQELLATIFEPLVGTDDVLLETASAYLEAGGALEATARTLFVHPNTVRYRLRRIAEVTGHVPTEPRGAFALRLALALGRMDPIG